MQLASIVPVSPDIAPATLTWLLATTGMLTSKANAATVAPLDAGVPSTPAPPTVIVSCPEANPSPLSCIAKVVTPFAALSVATLAMIPTIAEAPLGTWIDAVVLWP